MAYLNTSAPSHVASNISGFLGNAAKTVTGFFASIGTAMVVNSTAYHRLEQVERLQARSDAELSKLGLRREEIVHHVFRDLFWH
ncbi:hypothetical protein [Sulfitobacter aestuariivivens]|uniref:DUF1127 domain-containing protein n=1 Tax=Sulfitobacter aestuariivivens TaxID=2766981 RepID=A0A927D3S0_9RHOB|nr:hypothetical protein [Sulfitobacter aestuariivivens]MBD3663748.1 hypothetical protein [Sulfitobacter aestuariivivens]